MIAVLRLEQLLTRAEQSRGSDSDDSNLEAKLTALGEKVDPNDLE